MKSVVAALALALVPAAAVAPATVAAQSYPGDSGAGFKLGVQQLNNSGQIGSVTLFRRGVNKTAAVVAMDGVPSGRVEAVKLYRGSDCDTVAHAPERELADLKGRSSTSIVPMSFERLTSGNYNVIVFSSTAAGARSVACGHLYQS